MEQLLCDLGIKDRGDYRQWALRNHPDKSGDLERFQIVTNAVTSLLPTNDDEIECNDPPTPTNSPQHNGATVVPSPRRATCVRNMENWTKIMRHHRFDKPGFDDVQMREDMSIMSPKMNELIERIRKLDAADLATDGGLYKHFIFSDIKSGGYGAKIVASSLVAHGFHSCFSKSGKMGTPKPHKDGETFGILSSTSVYSKTFTKAMVSSVLETYNERPGNVRGERMRFVVLDSGFKEGIDLFDVKYVHIFERQRNVADLIQAVGRATRSCGQKGLRFVPNEGWKLHVYMYHSVDTAKIPLFDRYMAFTGVDMNKVAFAENLERLAVYSAVDHDLNREIHTYGKETKRTSPLPLRITGGDPNLGCNGGKCGKRPTKAVPFKLNLMRNVYIRTKKTPRNFGRLLTKDKRLFFCKLLQSDKAFCEAVNKAHLDSMPARSGRQRRASEIPPKAVVAADIEKNGDGELQDLMDMREDLRLGIKRSSRSSSAKEEKGFDEMSFDEHRAYVNRVFARYKYPKLQVRNGCDDPVTADDRVVKFTESQEFVSRYLTPASDIKGMLIWHSVGTGKTCTAISLKSLVFERQDYWVIWVTRSTLREDIWKNMYDKICDHRMRKLASDGASRETLRKNMYKRFLPPMSYRQFSNLVEGKNELSRRLIKENGRERILNNCLVIVDEAHKLYSKDLVGQERPDMRVVSEMIDRCESCKVLLMTGTPVADDPMEFFQLINLVLPPKDKFPTDFGAFHKSFLRDNEFTSTGRKRFLERTKGRISYLNRRFDPRQFTQPVFHEVPVPISVSNEEALRSCRADVLRETEACKSRTGLSEEDLRAARIASEERLRDALEQRDRANERLKMNRRDPDSKARADNSKALVKELMRDVRTTKSAEKRGEKERAKCERVSAKGMAKCKKSHDEASAFYQNVRVNSC